MSIIILPDPELKQTIGADAVLSYNISIGGFTMFGDGCDNGQGGISPVCGFSNYQAFGGTLNYQVFYSLDGNMPNDVEVFGSPGDTYLLTAPDGFSVTAWADVSYFFPVETGSGGFPGSVTVEVDVTGNSEELPEPATGFLVVISLVFLGWLHNRTNMATITRRFRLRPN